MRRPDGDTNREVSVRWSLIFLVAAAVGGLFYLQPWQRVPPAPLSGFGDSEGAQLQSRLDAHVRQSGAGWRKVLAALLVGVAVACMLFLFVPPGGQEPGATGNCHLTGPIGPGSKGTPAGCPDTGTAIGDGSASGAGRSNAGTALWTAATVACAAIGAGVVMLVAGPATWVRVAGAVPLAVGLTAGGHLVKEVKIGELVKFETTIEKLGLELELAWKEKLKELSAFGSEQLVQLNDFEPGQAELRPGMAEQIEARCRRWNRPDQIKRPGLLLVAGSTDRVPLSAALRRRYESNTGLARARAEKVRERMLACLGPSAPVLTVTTGPLHTPALTGSEKPAGAGQDRSVVVWALWNVPKEQR
jgi:hypothetical protein